MSYATAALATYANMLGTLDNLIAKASAHDKSEALLEARLAEDMFPLQTQIRYTAAQVTIALDRLGNLGLTLDESDITSFADARARVAAAQTLVAATDLASWPASEAIVAFDLPNGMAFAMQAHEYCRDWIAPQLYFHLTAAYAIMRKEGVAIGKVDYLPFMMKYLRQPAS